MAALLASLLAWAIAAWGWAVVPAIDVTFNPAYLQSPGVTVQARSWPDEVGACHIEVEAAWVEQGEWPGIIAHEVGHCLFYQYGWGFHLRCNCLMWSAGLAGPQPADFAQLANVAQFGHPVYYTVPGIAADHQ